jgi:Uma2 family endonuclease
VATTTTRLTIDDFEQLPSGMAEGHELVDGELIDVSGNTPLHNIIRDLLIALLLPFVHERRLGTVIGEQEYDFNGNAHGPDISFFGLEKQPLLQLDKRVQRFVPDLAIEIVSANDTFQSLMRKKERYRSCGTKEVWIISPEDCEVLVYSDRGNRILNKDAELSTPLIPGFQIAVKRLFETL